MHSYRILSCGMCLWYVVLSFKVLKADSNLHGSRMTDRAPGSRLEIPELKSNFNSGISIRDL